MKKRGFNQITTDETAPVEKKQPKRMKLTADLEEKKTAPKKKSEEKSETFVVSKVGYSKTLPSVRNL